MKSIYKKELYIYFCTPFGYIFIAIFLFLNGLVFILYNLSGMTSDINGMIGMLSSASITAFPILTMRLLSDEKKNQTDKLLYTSQLKIIEIILGKYFAALTVFALTLAMTLSNVIILVIYGEPTLGATIGSYLGFFLLGAAFIALCFFASSLVENAVTAAISGFGILFGLIALGSLKNTATSTVIKSILEFLDVADRFESFSYGILRPGPFIYYIGLCVICLALINEVIGAKYRKKSINNTVNSIVFSVCIIGALCFVYQASSGSPLYLDLTKQKSFTLSEQSIILLHNLEDDVNIIAFYRTGEEDPMVSTLLEQYRLENPSRISVTYADAEKDPVFASGFDYEGFGVYNASIAFETQKGTKLITQYDLYDQNNLVNGRAFLGEQQFTGAIRSLTVGASIKIYFLEGHDEAGLDNRLTKLKKRLGADGFDVNTINLLQSDIPDDCKALIIPSPRRDLSFEERRLLNQYLVSGGKAIILFDVIEEPDRIKSIAEELRMFGVDITPNCIIEENIENYHSNNKLYIIPNCLEHEITNPLGEGLLITMPISLNIGIIPEPERKKGIEITKLLETSPSSWIRYDFQNTSGEKTSDDIDGPATMAVAVTRNNADDKYDENRLVVIGNSLFISDDVIDIQGNYDFFANSLQWVTGGESLISIRPKLINADSLYIRSSDYIRLSFLSFAVFPGSLFTIAFIVWIIRKRK